MTDDVSLIRLYGWLRETGEIDRLIDLVIEKVRDARQTERAKDPEADSPARGWHVEAEAWKQTAENLQARADRFEFLRELLVAVVKTGTKDPLLDARIAEELRSHQ